MGTPKRRREAEPHPSPPCCARRLACRYGPPLLQLCAALLRAGERGQALQLLPRALPPRGLGFDALAELRPWHVAALKELLPEAAKHGGCWNLRREMLCTQALPFLCSHHAPCAHEAYVASFAATAQAPAYRPMRAGGAELRRDAALVRVLALRLPLEPADVADKGVVEHVVAELLRWGRWWSCCLETFDEALRGRSYPAEQPSEGAGDAARGV